MDATQVIKGGVNLLEQAEEQEKLLESSARELEKRKRKERQLRSQLGKKKNWTLKKSTQPCRRRLQARHVY